MIAKILTKSLSFSAIEYNEKKIENNLGDFVEACNFGILSDIDSDVTVSKDDYEKYLQNWSDRNGDIKYKQFHVSISCKGREYSKDQLIKIGKEWLKEMGYSGIPTLFYFHRDTPNNHIHIVTSRVGLNAQKINDSNERYRAREIINRIMRNDLKYNCRKDFTDALQFNFTGLRQFEMILNAKGYATNIEGDYIECSKEGKLLLKNPIDLIYWSEKRNKGASTSDLKNRKKQIYSIFKKYRRTASLNDFKNLMSTKFGLSLLFFGKDISKPYGYAIVDNKNKVVIKGSEVLNIKELLIPEADRIQQMQDCIFNIIDVHPDITKRDVSNELRKWGAVLFNHQVIEKSSKNILFTLTDEQMSKLNYNYKLTKVNSFNFKNEDERNILADVFSVHKDDIRNHYDDLSSYNILDADKEFYNDLLMRNDREFLRELGVFVVKGENDEFYIIDRNNEKIFSFSELEYDLEKNIHIDISAKQIDTGSDNLDEIIDFFIDSDEGLGMGGGADNRLRKRRKK